MADDLEKKVKKLEEENQKLKAEINKSDIKEEDSFSAALRKRARTMQTMINIGMVTSAVIALGIIATVIVLSVKGQEIPDELSNWGGVILGFYFGTLFGLAKDWIQPGAIQEDRD